MGRPSKLTDKQWAEIERRNLAGESVRSLAREFGVSETAIRLRGVSSQTAEIKDVAKQMVAVQERLLSLPVSSQVSAHNLAEELRAISGHLAGAAKFGSMTAHRLSQFAHASTGKIDDAASLEENADALKMVMAMTKGANDAAHVGLNLLAANKGTVAIVQPEPVTRIERAIVRSPH